METNKITEDYVLFETAKLLKEKGFEEECNTYFISDNEIALIPIKRDFNNHGVYLSAPTLQMTMKWLREVHGLFINLFIYEYGEGKVAFEIEKIPSAETVKEDYEYATYEEAAEAAIKYCLTNLIK